MDKKNTTTLQAQRLNDLSQTEGVTVTPQQIGEYLNSLTDKGRVPATREQYGRVLELFYEDLPADKTVTLRAIARWREQLLDQGYARGTINSRLSVVNNFLEFLGHRELQLKDFFRREEAVHTPDMTRTEYLRLLQVARGMGREMIYLIVKLIVLTGIRDQDIRRVRVEMVAEGYVTTTVNGKTQRRHIPHSLQRELLDYARREGLSEGVLFLGKNRQNAVHRSYVSYLLQRLCERAQVPVEKGNIRCLRKLYQATWEEIRSNMDLLLEEAYERRMEQEQCYVAWENRERSFSL